MSLVEDVLFRMTQYCFWKDCPMYHVCLFCLNQSVTYLGDFNISLCITFLNNSIETCKCLSILVITWSPSKTQVNKPIFLLILWSLYFPAWFAFLFFFQSFLHSELGLKPFFSPANRRKQKKKNSPYTSYYYLKWLDVMLHRRWDRWK